MTQSPEKIRNLVAFKEKLEKKIQKLDSEMKELQITLETVNSILLEKGFKRGDIKEIPSISQQETRPEIPSPISETTSYRKEEPENVIPLKTMNDEPLAIIYVSRDSLHVLPDESKNFNVNTPPFMTFLVERVLAKMQEKDSELVQKGQLLPEKIFAYEIIREGDLIREIVIRNVDEERLKDLKSSIRWTLEKMYEKT